MPAIADAQLEPRLDQVLRREQLHRQQRHYLRGARGRQEAGDNALLPRLPHPRRHDRCERNLNRLSLVFMQHS